MIIVAMMLSTVVNGITKGFKLAVESGRTQYELFLTKEMTLHILKLGESRNDLYLYSIKFPEILEMRIQDNDFIIITEQRGFTLGGIVDYAEMERCKLIIEREINKEKNGSN